MLPLQAPPGPGGWGKNPFIDPLYKEQLASSLAFEGAVWVSKEWTQASPLPPPPPIHKSVERTSKGNLFGLILLISSTFHYFPWDSLWLFPQAKAALWEARRSFRLARPIGEASWGGGLMDPGGRSSFTRQTFIN